MSALPRFAESPNGAWRRDIGNFHVDLNRTCPVTRGFRLKYPFLCRGKYKLVVYSTVASVARWQANDKTRTPLPSALRIDRVFVDTHFRICRTKPSIAAAISEMRSSSSGNRGNGVTLYLQIAPSRRILCSAIAVRSADCVFPALHRESSGARSCSHPCSTRTDCATLATCLQLLRSHQALLVRVSLSHTKQLVIAISHCCFGAWLVPILLASQTNPCTKQLYKRLPTPRGFLKADSAMGRSLGFRKSEGSSVHTSFCILMASASQARTIRCGDGWSSFAETCSNTSLFN